MIFFKLKNISNFVIFFKYIEFWETFFLLVERKKKINQNQNPTFLRINYSGIEKYFHYFSNKNNNISKLE